MNVLLPDRSQLILNPTHVQRLLDKYPYLTREDLSDHIKTVYQTIALQKDDLQSLEDDMTLECVLLLDEYDVAVPVRVLERARRTLERKKIALVNYGHLYSFLSAIMTCHGNRVILDYVKLYVKDKDTEHLKTLVSLLDKVPSLLITPYIKGEDERTLKLYIWKLVYSVQEETSTAKVQLKTRAHKAFVILNNVIKKREGVAVQTSSKEHDVSGSEPLPQPVPTSADSHPK